jgi:fructose-1,6-bisphosphatase I
MLIVAHSRNFNVSCVLILFVGALNIDVGIVTGTIFGVYNEPTECLEDFGEQISDRTAACLLGATQQKNLVAAGYCMYSSSTVLMLTMGEGIS